MSAAAAALGGAWPDDGEQRARRAKAARRALGMTEIELGRALRLAPANAFRSVRAWETGEAPVTGPVSVALDMLVAASLRPAWIDRLFDNEDHRRFNLIWDTIADEFEAMAPEAQAAFGDRVRGAAASACISVEQFETALGAILPHFRKGIL